MKVGVIAMNECQYTKCGKALRPQPETGGRKPQYCDETCRSRQRGAAAQSRRPKTGRCNACGEMFFRRARGRLGNVCPGKPECAAAVRAGRFAAHVSGAPITPTRSSWRITSGEVRRAA